MVVDEIERGLRILSPTHPDGGNGRESLSGVCDDAQRTGGACRRQGLKLVCRCRGLGRFALPASVAAQQRRDPETFLARVAVIAEGATEVGFVTTLLNRVLGEDLRRHGIWVSDGGSNSQALTVLRGLAASGLKVAGFVDNEATEQGLWQQVKEQLGDLLMRRTNGCRETNLIPHLHDNQLEAFVVAPDGDAGERLRTMADRLGLEDKSFTAIRLVISQIPAMIDMGRLRCSPGRPMCRTIRKRSGRSTASAGLNPPLAARNWPKNCLHWASGRMLRSSSFPSSTPSVWRSV